MQNRQSCRLIDFHCSRSPVAYRAAERLIVNSLFVTITNVNFDDPDIERWCNELDAMRKKFPDTAEMDMQTLWTDNEDIRSLKSLILFGLKGMAAYAHHAEVLGYVDDEVNGFFASKNGRASCRERV